MNPDEDLIYTRNLFIVFLVSLLLLILSGVFEYFFYIRKPFDGPIYKQKQTLYYRVKKWVAKMLMKLSRNTEIPNHLVDKLMVFNDKDQQVRFRIFFRASILTKLILFGQHSPSMQCTSIQAQKMDKFYCLERQDDEMVS